MDELGRVGNRYTYPGKRAVHFSPRILVRQVTPLHYLTQGSDLWISREDLQQKRENYHGIQQSLTLDPSFYEEGGCFLLGLDARKDRRTKYINMCKARDAVLQEQQRQNARSRWHCGIGYDVTQRISQQYIPHTKQAAKVAHKMAIRLEEELDVGESDECNQTSEIMSLNEVKDLLQKPAVRVRSISISSMSRRR
jgi:hypothetical protein